MSRNLEKAWPHCTKKYKATKGTVLDADIFSLENNWNGTNNSGMSYKDGQPSIVFVQAGVCGSISLTWVTEDSDTADGTGERLEPNTSLREPKWVELILLQNNKHYSITGSVVFKISHQVPSCVASQAPVTRDVTVPPSV